MLATVQSCTPVGIDGQLIQVEVDVSPGIPAFAVVGLPDPAVREAAERVRSAIKNAGLEYPARRITVNLAPAALRKAGPGFDLPIAMGVLAATGQIPRDGLERVAALGEMSLDGSLRPVRGVLPAAGALPADRVILGLPETNAAEAAWLDGLALMPLANLTDAVAWARSGFPSPAPRRARGPAPSADDQETPRAHPDPPGPPAFVVDLAEVRGQPLAARALEIACAGGHHLLLVGPPGAGKTMLARAVPGILPPLAAGEVLEVLKIHSVAGQLVPGAALPFVRPFRAPHHSISPAGLLGGGNPPLPGEVSLAHRGVLFLDEFGEFRTDALNMLRQPLEAGEVWLVRAGAAVRYPARFTLVGATNLCPCGRLGLDGAAGSGCACSPAQARRYLQRLSGPLLDRIDLQVEVARPPYAPADAPFCGEPSAAVRARSVAARARQYRRFGADGRTNATLTGPELRRWVRLDARGHALLEQAYRRLGLSVRAQHRILRVARTIADLAGAEEVGVDHLAEAVGYRVLDRLLAAG